MNWGSALAVYFIIWWVTLFVTLPFRMRSQADAEDVVEGSEPGAPANPQLLRRMVANTVLAAVVFAVYYVVLHVVGLSLDDMPQFFDRFEGDR